MPLRVINIYQETISDGFGIRYSIYLSGCTHRCKNCHNPQSWDSNKGTLLDDTLKELIVYQIMQNPILDGVTLSGGDPFFNPEELLEFLKFLKERTNANIWCYTGYTFEAIKADYLRNQSLAYIDVLIDGKFVENQADARLYFRGSGNQRIIYLKDSQIDFISYPELSADFI